MILSLGACIEFNTKQSCWAFLTLIYFLRYRSAIPGPLLASDLALRRRIHSHREDHCICSSPYHRIFHRNDKNLLESYGSTSKRELLELICRIPSYLPTLGPGQGVPHAQLFFAFSLRHHTCLSINGPFMIVTSARRVTGRVWTSTGYSTWMLYLQHQKIF